MDGDFIDCFLIALALFARSTKNSLSVISRRHVPLCLVDLDAQLHDFLLEAFFAGHHLIGHAPENPCQLAAFVGALGHLIQATASYLPASSAAADAVSRAICCM